ncbi:transketolase-like [Hetaerina americana]|uniref:transketolase-like n=1 Tax=Hetaerina americana TaxID=62018 RepID=UPI003A7F1833
MAELHQKPEDKVIQELQDIAHKLRIHSIRSTNASKSGHPTSCSSMAEIMSVLFFHTMRYKVSEPRHPSNDRFILSKGHAAPILYAAWAEVGLFPASDLLNLRKIDSDLEGHPTPRLNFVDIASGSLGQGLSVACGMAYVGKNIDKASYRVYCILGDGECAEGSVWEALNFASYYKLSNLCVILDINRLGQSEPTSLQHDMDAYRKRLEGFGFHALVVDGHDVEEICKAFSGAISMQEKPTAILAKTYKGKYFLDIENSEDWHGKPLGTKAEEVIKHLEGLIKNPGALQIQPQEPLNDDAGLADLSALELDSKPSYSIGEAVATRFAYGNALAKLGNCNKRVIALDGDTKNSTFSDKLRKVHPDQFIECFIAEQNMSGVAIGAACRDRCVVFASTFGAFFTRAFDQIRMGAISQTNANFVGSHCGVSIGEDGPSQMALEDLSLFRSIPGSTVFYPSDAVSCEYAVEIAAKTKGVCFIRTSRPNTPVIYKNDEVFEVGKARIVLRHPKDRILLISSGVTLHEAMKATAILEESGVSVRVMDLFTIKPIDCEGIKMHAKECGGKVITVEDHYPEGGIGEAVLSAVSEDPFITVRKLAVMELPRSGPPDLLLEKFGISAKCIARAVLQFLEKK